MPTTKAMPDMDVHGILSIYHGISFSVSAKNLNRLANLWPSQAFVFA